MSANAPPLYKTLNRLFASVFWPAAAGNVFWAIWSLIVDPPSALGNDEYASSLVVMSALTIYLTANWVLDFGSEQQVVTSPWYWVAQTTHVMTMVAVSMAATLRFDWIAPASAVFFLVNVMGHGSGLWSPRDGNVRAHVALHGTAAIACLIAVYAQQVAIIPITYGLVLALWIYLRRDPLSKSFSRRV